MEKNQIRLRINLVSREFEVDGDASYIDERFGNDINEYLKLIKQQKNSQSSSSFNPELSGGNLLSNNNDFLQSSKGAGLPDSFGEYFNRFAKSLSIVDKLLVASYYVQNKNFEKFFTLKEASDLLLDQGVKLSNPNVFNKANVDTKRIFKVTGKNFKVSDTGTEYINGLITT